MRNGELSPNFREQALETLKGLLYIDPKSRPGQALFLNARARLREKTGSVRSPIKCSSCRSPRRNQAPGNENAGRGIGDKSSACR